MYTDKGNVASLALNRSIDRSVDSLDSVNRSVGPTSASDGSVHEVEEIVPLVLSLAPGVRAQAQV